MDELTPDTIADRIRDRQYALDLTRLVHELADCLAQSIERDTDPGTNALGALWLARKVPQLGSDRLGPEMAAALRVMLVDVIRECLREIRRGEDRPAHPVEVLGFDWALACVEDDLPDALVTKILGGSS